MDTNEALELIKETTNPANIRKAFNSDVEVPALIVGITSIRAALCVMKGDLQRHFEETGEVVQEGELDELLKMMTDVLAAFMLKCAEGVAQASECDCPACRMRDNATNN